MWVSIGGREPYQKKGWSEHRKQVLWQSSSRVVLIDRRWKKKPKSKLEFLFCSSLWSDPQKQSVWATTGPGCFLPFRYGRSIWGQMSYCSSLLPAPNCHEYPTTPLLLHGWTMWHLNTPSCTGAWMWPMWLYNAYTRISWCMDIACMLRAKDISSLVLLDARLRVEWSCSMTGDVHVCTRGSSAEERSLVWECFQSQEHKCQEIRGHPSM